MVTENKRIWRRDYDRKRYQERKAYVLEKLGGVCKVCSSSDRLEVDHIDSSLKSFDVLKNHKKPIAELDEELKKCQLLCNEHHKLKTSKNRDHQKPELTHGTIHMYFNLKCRCDLCKLAASSYKKQLRAKRAGIA